MSNTQLTLYPELKLAWMADESEFILSAPWFCAAEVFYTLLMTSLKSEINERLPDASLRASVMGALSTSARLGSMASLSLIGLYLGSGGETDRLFLYSGGLACAALVLSLSILDRENQENKNAIPNPA